MNGIELVESAVEKYLAGPAGAKLMDFIQPAVEKLILDGMASFEARLSALETSHDTTAQRVDAIEALPPVAKAMDKAGQ